jgi:bifunctional non-homologous end joining protein LigD
MIVCASRVSADGPDARPRAVPRDGWVYEERVDGILAYKVGDRVRLVSRNGIDHTRRFPDLAAAVAALSARSLVLDGEVAVFDQQLRSRFDWLREPDPDAVVTPPVYIAFDVMYRDGRDVGVLPLSARRIHLEHLIAGANLILPARRLAANGLDAWAQVLASGFEGYVAKDEASEYRGGPTRSWLKVKVPGWTDPEDRWRRVPTAVESA